MLYDILQRKQYNIFLKVEVDVAVTDVDEVNA